MRTAPRGVQIAANNLIMSDAPGYLPASAHPNDLSADKGAAIVPKAAAWKKTPCAPDTQNEKFKGENAVRQVKADCSGSVYAIYREAGLYYTYQPTKSFASAAANGAIPFRKLGLYESPQAGDVVFY